MNGGGSKSGGAIGALFFAIGALLLFAFGFAFFLILPFFIFLGGIVAMIVSDSRRDSGPAPVTTETPTEPERVEVVR